MQKYILFLFLHLFCNKFRMDVKIKQTKQKNKIFGCF